MRQSIIDKFDLKPTDMCFGRSFVHDITCYVDPYGNFFAMCDPHGEPINYVMVFAKRKKHVYFTEESLADSFYPFYQILEYERAINRH